MHQEHPVLAEAAQESPGSGLHKVMVSGEDIQVNNRQGRSPVGKVAVLGTCQSHVPALPQGREDQLHQL